jgi:hypothetical protein
MLQLGLCSLCERIAQFVKDLACAHHSFLTVLLVTVYNAYAVVALVQTTAA